jgi:hypothetical protein
MIYDTVGVDGGTTYMKNSMGDVFPSGVSEIIYPNAKLFKVNNKCYSMELTSSFDMNINKGLNKNTRVAFLYAMAKMCNYQDTRFKNVLIGIPPNQWENEIVVEQYKKYLFPNSFEVVEIDGFQIIIEIDNIDVVPEGSTAYFAKEMNFNRFGKRKVLIPDWGGLTLNSNLFENNRLIGCHTEELGILKTYQKMANKLTSDLGKNIRYLDMFDILTNGLMVNGKKYEPKEIQEMVESIAIIACEEAYHSLELRWGVSTIPYVPFIGASSITMIEYIKHFIPNVELTPNPQTIAVNGMIDMFNVEVA